MRSISSFSAVMTVLLCGVALAGAPPGTTRYFPPSDLASDWDVSGRELFADFLNGTDQPSLQRERTYAIRVTAFSAREVNILTIQRETNESATATFGRYGFRGMGIDPRAKSRVERMVPDTDFSDLVNTIRDEDFFSLGLPSYFVTDGNSSWLIEVNDGKKYHSVFRPVLDPGTPFGKIAAAAARAADVRYFSN